MVVSARPDNMDSCAATWDGLDGALADTAGTLRTAYEGFVSANRWGTLDATALVGNVDSWIGLNREDSRWLRTAAQAFREGDARGADLCYATDTQIASALSAAGFQGGRTDLAAVAATATGGQATTGFASDPVNAASGDFIEAEVDLAFGPTLKWLQVRRTYNSLGSQVGPFGPGWSSWASTSLRVSASGRVARLRGPDGQVVEVPMSTGRVAGFEGRVAPDGEGGLVARFELEDTSWRFDAEGRPVEVDGGPGARMTLGWQGERLVEMAHERGRHVHLVWEGDRIVGAEADDGRRVAYGYDAEGRLVSVDGPLGERRYEWDARGRMSAAVDADGVVAVRNAYDPTGRVLAQETAFGRRVRFSYRPGLVTEVDDEQGGPSNTWTHDEQGRLAQAVDGHGQATTTLYGEADRPLEVIDRRGASTRYRWDGDGRCRRIERPDGTAASLEWDDRNRCVATVGPGGTTCRFTYEGDERSPATIEDPEGGVTRLDVADGLVRRVVDPDGVTTVFAYDPQGRLVGVTDGNGATRRYEWDAAGQLVAETSPLGHGSEIERDAGGRVIGRRDPDGARWRVERSPAGRAVAVVDPTGARRELRHGPHGNVVEDIDPTGAVTSHRWDEHGALVATVLPDGGKWLYTHDALLRTVAVTDPTGSTWLTEHDAEGAAVATVTPTGVRRAATVDDAGFVTGVDDGLTSVSFDYDGAGRAVAQVRPDGTAVRAAYDRCGRTVAVTEASGAVSRFEYSHGGRLTAVVGPTGARVTYRYDGVGRLCEVTDAVGGRRRLRYDADGRLVRVTGPTGEVTRYTYDAAGRVVAVMAPAGRARRYAYDAAGRVVSVTDPNGAVTRYGYDLAGRVVSVVDPNGGELRLERDVMGRVVAQVDPAGGRTAYRLDAVGRPVDVVDPLGRRTGFTYDAAGRLVCRLDPDGARCWWRWDDSDRLAASGVDGTTVTFERDLLGRVTRVDRDGHAAVSRRWDADGNLVLETVGAATASWGRDAVGNVVAATLEAPGLGMATTAYELDPAGRPVAVDDPALGRITIERDAASRPVRVAGGGLVEGRTWEDGALTAWSRQVGGNEVTSVRFTRDLVGRVVAEHHGDGRHVDYRYDAAGQLTGVDTGTGSLSFRWDAAGRLVGEDGPSGHRRYTYDAAGQLAAVDEPAGRTQFEWDPCGRRLASAGPHGKRRYRWDTLGQLAGIETIAPDGAFEARALAYDAAGRLAAVDGTSLHWDPTGPIERLWAVGDHRLVGAGPVPHGLAGPAGVAWPLGDTRGEPPGLDPWGSPLADDELVPGPPGPTLPGGLGVGHRGELTIDGLVWLRARTYDPATRSFLSPDPLPGLAGHPWGANPYHYAANDPVGHADPAGLQPLSDADLADIRDNWDRGAWDRYGGYIVGGLMIVGGGALMLTGVGGVGGAMLIGAAFSGGVSAVSQQAFTGEVNWARVGTDMLIGAGAGGLGFAAGGSSLLAGMSPVARGAAVGTGESIVGGMASRATYGQNPLDPRGLATDVLTGGAGGAVGGRLGAPNPDPSLVSARGSTTYLLPEYVPNVNPLRSGDNCVSCAIATDSTLAGVPASAIDLAPTPATRLEAFYGQHAEEATTRAAIESTLAGHGDGARGIVIARNESGYVFDDATGLIYGSDSVDGSGTPMGHVFNVADRGGEFRYFDGQDGSVPPLERYTLYGVLYTGNG